jgi:hypothetical protein
MFHCEDFDGSRALAEEEYAIIADPEPQVLARWTKLLNFADAASQIIINGVQYVERSFAVDRRNRRRNR